MKDLLAKLEAAPEADQERLIMEALQYAYDHDWITGVTFVMVRAWVPLGAYLSAAMVLLPKGAAWSISQSDDRDDQRPCGVVQVAISTGEEFAATPALALALAALKARD